LLPTLHPCRRSSLRAVGPLRPRDREHGGFQCWKSRNVFETESWGLWRPSGVECICDAAHGRSADTVRGPTRESGPIGAISVCCAAGLANDEPGSENAGCKHRRVSAVLEPCTAAPVHQAGAGFWFAWVHQWRCSRWCTRPGVRTCVERKGAGFAIWQRTREQTLGCQEFTAPELVHVINICGCGIRE